MNDVMEDFILRLSIQVPGFLLAIVCHEAAHAYMAYRFGDDTAKSHGRLTLNPSAHLDLIGSIIFPIIGALLGGIMFGWAKPVPVDVRRFKKIKSGIFWVSFAGPGANLILGTLSAFFLVVFFHFVPQHFYLYGPLLLMMKQSVYINMILAVFNLIPLPPLDGSKMLSTVLSYSQMQKYEQLARYSFIIFLVLVYTRALGFILYPAYFAADNIISLFERILL